MKGPGVFILVLVVVGVACTKAEKSPEETPAYQEAEQVQSPARIFLELDAKELASAKSGDEVSISLQDGSIYSLKIQQYEETMPGIVTISAYVNDQETGQATLILRDGKLAGSVNMFTDGTSYELGFDEESEKHYLIPVDDKDVLPGGTPLETPRQNG